MEFGGRTWRGESLSSMTWAFHRTPVCIEGELEHHKAFPSLVKKNIAVCSARRQEGIYKHIIGPGSWLEPVLKTTLWSRFKPPTGTNDEARQAPWPHEPGPMPHVSRFVTEPGLMGLSSPNENPIFY